jgi:hypothetical protein
MSEQKAAEPEIPDEIRAKLGKPKRPGGFSPLSHEADGNAEVDEPKTQEKDLSKFFSELKTALASGPFYRTEVVEREAKVWNAKLKEHEYVREKRNVKVEVTLRLGDDGLPYLLEPVSTDETRRIRQMTYKDAPVMSPSLGDLTPEFVEWLYLNHPYDAAVRYFSRSTHVQAWAVAHS